MNSEVHVYWSTRSSQSGSSSEEKSTYVIRTQTGDVSDFVSIPPWTLDGSRRERSGFFQQERFNLVLRSTTYNTGILQVIPVLVLVLIRIDRSHIYNHIFFIYKIYNKSYLIVFIFNPNNVCIGSKRGFSNAEKNLL